jgi:hypothetical protein
MSSRRESDFARL